MEIAKKKKALDRMLKKQKGGKESSILFVKGFLKAAWTHCELDNAFKKFGNIISAKLSIDKNHQSKGYGYVQFSTVQEASKALEQMNNSEISEGISLIVAFF